MKTLHPKIVRVNWLRPLISPESVTCAGGLRSIHYYTNKTFLLCKNYVSMSWKFYWEDNKFYPTKVKIIIRSTSLGLVLLSFPCQLERGEWVRGSVSVIGEWRTERTSDGDRQVCSVSNSLEVPGLVGGRTVPPRFMVHVSRVGYCSFHEYLYSPPLTNSVELYVTLVTKSNSSHSVFCYLP